MDENKVNHAICDAHALLQEYMTEGISLMSPSQAPLYKRNNRYHMQIFILADARKDLHRLLNDTWQRILALNSVKMTKMTLDIDPMGF